MSKLLDPAIERLTRLTAHAVEVART